MEIIRKRGNNMDNEKEMYPEVIPEIEGMDLSWYYICPECRSVINWHDPECRNCHRRIKWDEDIHV